MSRRIKVKIKIKKTSTRSKKISKTKPVKAVVSKKKKSAKKDLKKFTNQLVEKMIEKKHQQVEKMPKIVQTSPEERKFCIQKIKETLLEEKKKVEESLSKPTPTLKDVDTHGDEMDKFQGEILITTNSRLKERERERLKKIEIALQKIQMNSFGNCIDCGEEIPEKRLFANPHALICLGCAEIQEIENEKEKIRQQEKQKDRERKLLKT